jgi:hypothetical protein
MPDVWYALSVKQPWAALLTTPQLRVAAELRGGVVGVGELIGCVAYPTRTAFEADRGRHLNLPDWFVDGGLHGFAFRDLRPVEFVPCAGNTFFFPVEGFELSFSPLPQGERGRE